MTEPYLLKLLGGVSLAGPDRPFEGPVTQHRRLALLALLAMARNGSLSRDKLIATLWPERPAESARHSLSDAVHILRRTLGGSAILASGDDLRLDPKEVGSDVAAFEAAVEGGALERAVGLYEGPFLDGFSISGAVEFDHWAATERKRLAGAYEGVLERLAESAAARGDPRRAAEWWHRLCTENPDNSRAVMGLMTALTAAGDRAGALRQADEHEQHLKSEFGAEPDPTVTALARRLQEEPDAWVPGPVSDRASGGTAAADPLGTRVQRTFAPRPAFLGAAAAAVLILLTAFYVAQRQSGPDLTPEEVLAAGAAPGIAVLPFTVNDPTLGTWREGMVDLLSVNLDGVPDLRAIDNRTLLARWAEAVPDAARADLATALAVARRTGARYALVGSVVAVGSDLRLTAEVYEVRGGARLGRGQVAGAPDSILSLVDRLTLEILKALPREGSVLADVDLAELTTDSLAALKAFLSGEALYRRGDFKASAAAYERAIASDSTFALAWVRLNDTCWWSSGSELCGQEPWEFEELLSRLPARKAEMIQSKAQGGPFESLRQMVRKYPDDPDAWYQLGDRYTHFGGTYRVDRAEGDRALERAIALAPTTSAEPYIHLIEHAFADADGARIARLMDAYERLTRGAGIELDAFRLAFALGFGDPANRARTRAALDTISTPSLSHAIQFLGNPHLHGPSEEALRVLLARPYHPEVNPYLAFWILYPRGKLRAALDSMEDSDTPPARRARLYHRFHLAGVSLPPEELERILALGAPDTTDPLFRPTFLLVGAYAVDRGQWDEYAAALDWERARVQRLLASAPDWARENEGAALAMEGYALWKRGQKEEAIRALEAAQELTWGWESQRFAPWFNYDVTVRWWLGELLLEVGRPRDAERYFKSISADPFVALRLGKVYEDLGEPEKARASYEYALMSWQDADPELQPRIQEARHGLARSPKPIQRENP